MLLDAPAGLQTEGAENPLGTVDREPRFGWQLPDGLRRQSGYRILVASEVDQLHPETVDIWDSGPVETGESTRVAYDGPTLDWATRYHWRVRVFDEKGRQSGWSEPAWFETELPESEWAGQWVAGPSSADKEVDPVPLLRRSVDLTDEVDRARLYISAAGMCEVTVNGSTVDECVLGPAMTDYTERVLYSAADVTEMVSVGENVFGVRLGRGRYALTTEDAWGWHRAPWTRDRPALRLHCVVEYADGSRDVVVTDRNWRACDGPTRFDSVYEGERYDARLERPGWRTQEYDDGGWDPVEVVEGPDGTLASQRTEPMRIVREVEPVKIEAFGPSHHVFDFGEMVAGWTELQTTAEAGTEITLTHGEQLCSDGSVAIDAPWFFGGKTPQVDTYTAGSDSTENWESAFSYKGFRYVAVRGLDDPDEETLTAKVVHTDIDETKSDFRSSDPLLERIDENARRAVRNNWHGIPTDTPVFEKNAWTADEQLTAEAALCAFNPSRFYRKWLDDFADAQRDTGELPPIVPSPDWGYSDGSQDPKDVFCGPVPGWDCAYVFLPYWLYRYCGDEDVLANHYNGMVSLVDYLAEFIEDGILSVGLGDWDAPLQGACAEMPTGVPMEENRPPEGPAITSTAYYYRMLTTLETIAEVLERPADAKQFGDRAGAVRDDFNEHFLDRERSVYTTGEVREYRQTSNVIPLVFGLVPDGHPESVVENLVRDVAENHHGHLNTGMLGTKYLLPVLTDHGYVDLAYQVASQTTYPSWGHWIKNGATSLYEEWELDARSRNHAMFGSVLDWFYQYLAGISPLEPGFETVSIAPVVPSDLSSAGADIETVRGVVSSFWICDDEGFELTVDVPPNTTAVVTVPFGDASGTGESVSDMSDSVIVRDTGNTDTIFEVPAGSWSFTTPAP